MSIVGGDVEGVAWAIWTVKTQVVLVDGDVTCCGVGCVAGLHIRWYGKSSEGNERTGGEP